MFLFFFFNDTATTEIYTLSLHDALPISRDFRERDVRQPHGDARGHVDPDAVRLETWPRQQQLVPARDHANLDLRGVAHDLTVDRQLRPGARVDGQIARLAWCGRRRSSRPRGRSRRFGVTHRIHRCSRDGCDWAPARRRDVILVRGCDGAPDALIVALRHACAGLEECDAGNDERRSDANGDQRDAPPVARRRLPHVVHDLRERRRPRGLSCHRPITSNLALVARVRPADVAVSQHPVHAPVTFKLLNVAMPFTALTLVWPLKTPRTICPLSVSDTRPVYPVAVPPWASNAVTSTENELPTCRPLGGSRVKPICVAGGGGGGGGRGGGGGGGAGGGDAYRGALLAV